MLQYEEFNVYTVQKLIHYVQIVINTITDLKN